MTAQARVHYARGERMASGRARAACGQWSANVTADPERTDCEACRKAIAAERRRAAAAEA